MKTISNWTLVGYAISIVYAVVTIWHYWIQYPDTSQFLMNMAIAALVASVSWIYSRLLEHSNTITSMEDYLSEINRKEVKNG